MTAPASVMMLSREKFAEFSKLPIADPKTHALALYCFSVPSRDGAKGMAESGRIHAASDSFP